MKTKKIVQIEDVQFSSLLFGLLKSSSEVVRLKTKFRLAIAKWIKLDYARSLAAAAGVQYLRMPEKVAG